MGENNSIKYTWLLAHCQWECKLVHPLWDTVWKLLKKLKIELLCSISSTLGICCCCCSVVKSCLTLCDPMDYSRPGSSVLYYLLEFAQIHDHWVGDAIQPSHPLLPPSPCAFNLSQHQGLFQWIGSSHQVAKVLDLQLQHQPFMNIQGWFPLGLTSLIFLLSKRL